MAGETDTAKNIALKKMQPLFICYLCKRFWRKNTYIIDQYVNGIMVIEQMLYSGCISKVSSATLHCTIRDSPAQLVQSTIDTRFCPSVDNDAGAFLQQPAGNAKSNPSGGTGDKGCFSCEFKIQLVTDRYKFTRGKFTK